MMKGLSDIVWFQRVTVMNFIQNSTSSKTIKINRVWCKSLPAFCLIQSSFFTETSRFILASMMVLSSCFQFCCEDLKVHRNYFKRWPSAWSIVVICLFTWPVPEIFFFYVIILFSILSFVPIYFAHSLRADVKFESCLS